MTIRAYLVISCMLTPVLAWPQQANVGGYGGHDWSTWRHLVYYRFLPNLWRKE